MTALPAKTEISDVYPNPSNATARAGFAKLWDAINEATEKPELDIASGTTCDIGGQLSTKLRITGTTTITSFGTNYRGPIHLRTAGALTITHNSTTLICPGGASITTTAGDVFVAWPKSTTSGTADGWLIVRDGYGGGAAAEFAAIKQAATTSTSGAVELATDAEAQAGTDATRCVTPDNLGATVLGIGQTWQDVKASRAASTTYTNSTGRPIMVCAGLVTSSTCSIIVTLNGVTFPGSSYNASGGINTACFVVPSGATYSVANNAGTSVVSGWAELR